MALHRWMLRVVIGICCFMHYFANRNRGVDDFTSTSDLVIVDTTSGKILGRRDNADGVNSFLGIPYAEPPTGRLRFRPPRPKRAWYPSLYRALNFAPECLQSTLYAAEEDEDSDRIRDEDCLYLNIWQPATKRKRQHKAKGGKDELLPVMIWVYGGAFIHGGASKPEYVGNRLAARGVIVVSFNYRLGALGFLVSVADGLYGNYGLDDQKTAIQWVRDNIHAFGGDSERITLYGESAGAMSIGLHLLDQQHQLQRRRYYQQRAARAQARRMREQQQRLAAAGVMEATITSDSSFSGSSMSGSISSGKTAPGMKKNAFDDDSTSSSSTSSNSNYDNVTTAHEGMRADTTSSSSSSSSSGGGGYEQGTFDDDRVATSSTVHKGSGSDTGSDIVGEAPSQLDGMNGMTASASGSSTRNNNNDNINNNHPPYSNGNAYETTGNSYNNNNNNNRWEMKEDNEKSSKLFHAVILQSNPLGYKYRSIAVANFIGAAYKEQLDCEDLRCLQSESPEELMHVQDTLMAVPRSIGDFFTWGPVVTDSSYYREIRLRPGPISNVTVKQPIDALKDLRKLDVPVVIGTTSHEGTVFVFTAFPTRLGKFVYQALVFSFFRGSALKVLRMYAPLARRVADLPYPDYRLVLSRIIGDYLFRCPNQYFASQLTALGTAVFYYEFALATRTPGFPCCDGLACHTCELPYVFNHMGIIESDYSWLEASSLTPSSSTSTSTFSSSSSMSAASDTDVDGGSGSSDDAYYDEDEYFLGAPTTGSSLSTPSSTSLNPAMGGADGARATNRPVDKKADPERPQHQQQQQQQQQAYSVAAEGEETLPTSFPMLDETSGGSGFSALATASGSASGGENVAAFSPIGSRGGTVDTTAAATTHGEQISNERRKSSKTYNYSKHAARGENEDQKRDQARKKKQHQSNNENTNHVQEYTEFVPGELEYMQNLDTGVSLPDILGKATNWLGNVLLHRGDDDDHHNNHLASDVKTNDRQTSGWSRGHSYDPNNNNNNNNNNNFNKHPNSNDYRNGPSTTIASGSSAASSARLKIDHEVSRLIADFWTTFAKYGDPNGLPGAQSNGYQRGTRPEDAPWWPRLLGDLPSQQAVRDIQRETNQRQHQHQHQYQQAQQQQQQQYGGSASDPGHGDLDINMNSYENDPYFLLPELEESMEDLIGFEEEERRFLMDRQQREGYGYYWEEDYDWAASSATATSSGGSGGGGGGGGGTASDRDTNGEFFSNREHRNSRDRDREFTSSSRYQQNQQQQQQHYKQQQQSPSIGQTIGRKNDGYGDGLDEDILLAESRKQQQDARLHAGIKTSEFQRANLLNSQYANVINNNKNKGNQHSSSSHQYNGQNKMGKFHNSGFNTQKFMHQMIFDDDSSVNIIENDCVCSAWNLLEYRF